MIGSVIRMHRAIINNLSCLIFFHHHIVFFKVVTHPKNSGC